MSNIELFSTDNEVAILSIVLNNPNKIFDLRHLKPFMMSSTTNQLVLDTMQELAKQKFVPDTQLITNYLTASGKLESAGGVQYLNYLKSKEYQEDNLLVFERMVVESYKAKELISLSTRLPGMTTDGNSVDKVIEYVRHTIDNLEISSGGDQTQSIDSILEDSWKEIQRKVENPGVVGLQTSFYDIDLNTGGCQPGDLWIVAARPSMGKTAWLCNSILGTSKLGNPALSFSYEMGKQALIERLLAIETKIPISDIKMGMLNQEKIDKVKEVMRLFKTLPIYIDTNFSGNLQYVSSTIRRYHKTHGIKIAYLDYIQLMAERSANATNELGQISREFKLLANDLGIVIILFSQLNRGVEMREDKRPVLSDLRQSGNLEEDADIVNFLYRDDYYYKDSKYPGIMENIIRKNRSGATGTVLMGFEDVTNIISRIK